MMDAEAARYLLRHVLPSGAWADRFKRTFRKQDRSALLNAGCCDAQIERLERILPAIAAYTEAAPRLADVRALLANLHETIGAAAAQLCAILDAPDGGAGEEARGLLLDSCRRLYPARCVPDSQHAAFFEKRPPPRGLLSVLLEVQTVAEDARRNVQKGQTRTTVSLRPVMLIDAALSVDGPQFTPSERGPFARITSRCYLAAGLTGKPLRAIRAYLQARNTSPEK